MNPPSTAGDGRLCGFSPLISQFNQDALSHLRPRVIPRSLMQLRDWDRQRRPLVAHSHWTSLGNHLAVQIVYDDSTSGRNVILLDGDPVRSSASANRLEGPRRQLGAGADNGRIVTQATGGGGGNGAPKVPGVWALKRRRVARVYSAMVLKPLPGFVRRNRSSAKRVSLLDSSRVHESQHADRVHAENACAQDLLVSPPNGCPRPRVLRYQCPLTIRSAIVGL